MPNEHEPGTPDAGENVLKISEDAQAQVRGILEAQANPEALALWLEVSGASGGEYTYDMYLQETAESGDGDAITRLDGLTVVIPSESIDVLNGSTLDLEGDIGEGTLVLSNPNTPPQAPGAPQSQAPAPAADLDLDDPLTARVHEVLTDMINPAIASHGGFAELVAVEDTTAYLRLGGGCQGCGMAAVTLGQGIEVAIREEVPEIEKIVDVTDHAAGTNPYFEQSKK